jgi:hypothetical protein
MNMISLRGGLAKLGLEGVLRSCIEFGQATDMGDSFQPDGDKHLAALSYPSLPFSPQLCSNLARVPLAFTEIALTGRLSYQTIDAIASLQDWLIADPAVRDLAPSRQILAARRCISALPLNAGHRMERSVCLGIVVTSMRMFHARFSRMDRPILEQILDVARSLHRAIPRTEKEVVAERQHMAFLTVLVVEACDLVLELQDEVSELVELLLEREYFAWSWLTLEPVLRTFFSLPPAIDKWRTCWTRHLQRQLRESETRRMTSPEMYPLG